MDHIQTVKIHDVEDDEIYTTKIQKSGKRWIGWIQEHPKVKCEANTQDGIIRNPRKYALSKSLKQIGKHGTNS